MQYQGFVKSQSDKHFTASIMGMPSIAVDGDTEAEAIANAKTALDSQLAMGKIVTISIPTSQPQNPWIEFGGVFKDDPDFADIAQAIRAERASTEKDTCS